MTTTGIGSCVAVTDQMTLISFTAAPVVNAGAPVSLCANNALVTLSGSVSGFFRWSMERRNGNVQPEQHDARTATYTPTAAEVAAGTLTLTLSEHGKRDLYSSHRAVKRDHLHGSADL
jgi:hypothetical protein